MHDTIARLRALGVLVLAVLTLAACSTPVDRPAVGAGAPTPPRSPVSPTTSAVIPARPTPPADAPVEPSTLVPRAAILGFEPQVGGPGTEIAIWGAGYAPGAPVVVRLGFPDATGEVLVSAVADASGAWRTSLIIPDRLPSGERITSAFHLIAMNEHNQALASAPFGFVQGAEPADPGAPTVGPTREEAPQAVEALLGAWQAARDYRPYLTAELRAALAAGTPTDQVLGLRPIELVDFTVYAAADRPSEVLFVPATLRYHDVTEQHLFTLVVEDGAWKIHGGSRDASAPARPGLRYFWPTTLPLGVSVQPDRSHSTADGWMVQLAQPHTTVAEVIISGGLLGEAPGRKLEDVTVRGMPASTYAFDGGSAVVWQEDNETYLVSGSRPLVELLEIANGLEAIDRAVWEQRIRHQ